MLGASGEKWVIDSIRTWAVPGRQPVDPDHLGDFYQDVRLYFGASGGDVTPVASALLSPGNDESSDPRVRITEATRAGAQLYDDFGKFLRVWQVEFTGLNLSVDGGVNYRFGVWGMGREIPDKADICGSIMPPTPRLPPFARMAPMVSCCCLMVPAKLPVNLSGRGMVGIRIRMSTFRSSRIA